MNIDGGLSRSDNASDIDIEDIKDGRIFSEVNGNKSKTFGFGSQVKDGILFNKTTFKDSVVRNGKTKRKFSEFIGGGESSAKSVLKMNLEVRISISGKGKDSIRVFNKDRINIGDQNIDHEEFRINFSVFNEDSNSSLFSMSSQETSFRQSNLGRRSRNAISKVSIISIIGSDLVFDVRRKEQESRMSRRDRLADTIGIPSGGSSVVGKTNIGGNINRKGFNNSDLNSGGTFNTALRSKSEFNFSNTDGNSGGVDGNVEVSSSFLVLGRSSSGRSLDLEDVVVLGVPRKTEWAQGRLEDFITDLSNSDKTSLGSDVDLSVDHTEDFNLINISNSGGDFDSADPLRISIF